MNVTVDTQANNWAHLGPRRYKSLQRQSFSYFGWVIIDDESTDDTRELGTEGPHHCRLPTATSRTRGAKVTWNRGVELSRGDDVGVVGPDTSIFRTVSNVSATVERGSTRASWA
jgi:hypothetical protein